MCSTINPNKLQETSEKTTTTTTTKQHCKNTNARYKYLRRMDKNTKLLPIKREHSIHVLLLVFLLQEVSSADNRCKSHNKRENASTQETWNQYPHKHQKV